LCGRADRQPERHDDSCYEQTGLLQNGFSFE
jgi:hypothetical protein